MTGKVTAVTTAGNAPLKAGTVVLSATDKAKAPLAGLKVGDTVSLDFAFQDERWANVAFSFGGSAILAQDGQLAALPRTTACTAIATPAPPWASGPITASSG